MSFQTDIKEIYGSVYAGLAGAGISTSSIAYGLATIKSKTVTNIGGVETENFATTDFTAYCEARFTENYEPDAAGRQILVSSAEFHFAAGYDFSTEKRLTFDSVDYYIVRIKADGRTKTIVYGKRVSQ